MRCTIDKKDLVEVVKAAAKVAPARSAVPIYTAVCVAADDGRVTASAFDPDAGASLRTSIPAGEIDTAGSVYLPGKALSSIVAALPAGKVVLDSDGKRTTIRAGRSKFNLGNMPADEYPSLPAIPALVGTVEYAALATAVSQVAFAAARDGDGGALTGVHIEFSDKMLTLVATDRYRASKREVPWESVEGFEATAVTIPAAELLEAVRTMSAGERVNLHLNNARIAISSEDSTVTVGLYDGDYVRWHVLFQGQRPIVIRVNTAALRDTVSRVSLVTDTSSQAIHLSCTADSITVSATGQGTSSDATEALPATLEGTPVELLFNRAYLAEGLAHARTESVELRILEPIKPAILTADDFTYLVMPVRPTS